LERLDDLFFALNLIFQVNDVTLELNDPSFTLGNFFVQRTNLPFQLLNDVHVVAFLKIKLPYPNFVFADTVLIFSDFFFLLTDLIRQLIVLFDRFVVLPTNFDCLKTESTYSASSVHIVL
jgi:hypothetical protein